MARIKINIIILCLGVMSLSITGCLHKPRQVRDTDYNSPNHQGAWDVHKFPGTRTRTYFLVAPAKHQVPLPVLIFLHGLDGETPSAKQTFLHYQFLARQAKDLGFLAVFPRGLMGAYPDQPNSLAWGQSAAMERENRIFILDLLKDLKSRFPLDERRIVLAGFSNGAYFVSKELATQPETPFTAFWIEAGGSYKKFVPRNHSLPRVYINIGRQDKWNIESSRELRDLLLKNGWESSKNLRYKEHSGGHVIKEENLSELWDYLFKY